MRYHSPAEVMTKRSAKNLLAMSVGSQVAEAALVLPLVFMMLLGIYWFGRAFNIYATINHAAQLGARAGAAQTCATCGNASNLTSQTPTIITNLMNASHVDPNQIQSYAPTLPACVGGSTCTPAGANGNITLCNNVQISPATSPGPPVCGVAVTFQYPYQFWLPFTSLNNQQITLKVNVQMKGEY
ncbi:MAG TPA: TadE/TadG family type IV pilus assembly protein [Terriglobales bacterium]|nr:TadE/TadG family type IV pilus assembly protein [Terriglobales bacterium]